MATRSKTAVDSTMTREVTLDANVIVAHLDEADALSQRAQALARRLREQGADLVLLDVLVSEAVSVLCRRARERRSGQPDLSAVLTIVRGWAAAGSIRWIAGQAERVVGSVLDVIQEPEGRLNFNDALLVILQREGLVEEVASFDRGLTWSTISGESSERARDRGDRSRWRARLTRPSSPFFRAAASVHRDDIDAASPSQRRGCAHVEAMSGRDAGRNARDRSWCDARPLISRRGSKRRRSPPA